VQKISDRNLLMPENDAEVIGEIEEEFQVEFSFEEMMKKRK
jgi:hypothetical protein